MSYYFLLGVKGIKARKKRLAGSGGGGTGIVNPIEGAAAAKNNLNIPHSQAQVRIVEVFTNGGSQVASLPNPLGGTTAFHSQDVEDYVATGIRGASNHQGNGFANYDGEISLPAGSNFPSGTVKYTLEFGAYMPHNTSSPITTTLSILVDANNNLSTPPNPITNNFSFAGLSIDTKNTGTTGFAIIKLTHTGTGFTTNADSDVIAGNQNAVASDTFYLKINFA